MLWRPEHRWINHVSICDFDKGALAKKEDARLLSRPVFIAREWDQFLATYSRHSVIGKIALHPQKSGRDSFPGANASGA